jgi:hypothetical protein
MNRKQCGHNQGWVATDLFSNRFPWSAQLFNTGQQKWEGISHIWQPWICVRKSAKSDLQNNNFLQLQRVKADFRIIILVQK